MSCGGRVYKGDTVTISVPFDVDDYSNLTITYTTIGGEKIVKTQEEVEIEDGFITYTFEPGELDLLPDGVIYYAISYEVDGVDHVESTNTNLYLKTPAGYSGRTAEDYYQEGYEAGLEDCSGGTCNLESGATIDLDTWYDGWATVEPTLGYDGFKNLTIRDRGYGQEKYDQGYQAGQADCSGETPCDCTEAYQSGITYQKSLLSAITIIANGTYYRPDGYDTVEVTVEDTPQLEVRSYNIDENWNGESGEIYPNTQLGFVGFRYFQVFDIGYGQKKYDDGYQAGLADCSGSTDCSSAVTEAWGEGYSSGSTDGWNGGYETGWQSGYTMGLEDCSGCSEVGFVGIDSAWGGFETYRPLGACPFSEFTVSDNGYGQYKYDQGYVDGHASGYTEGYDDGYLSGASTTDCSQAISIAYDNGHYLGYIEGKDSVIKSLLTENDTDLVIGYYYTSARTMCLITGEYHDSNIDYDGNSAFVSMSVNGGSWRPVEKYLELPAGWSQVRFSGCTTLLLGAFSHRFTPSQQCDMDALKIVSLPTMVDGLSNTYTFHMNDGLRVIASSCGIIRGATNGADNINVVITHYTGNQREYNYFPSNGVLFIPEGSTADWASILPNWTHIEMF